MIVHLVDKFPALVRLNDDWTTMSGNQLEQETCNSQRSFASYNTLSVIALASGHFVKKSVHVMMYMFPEAVRGSGPTRSIPIRCQGLSTEMGWSVAAGSSSFLLTH